MSPHVGFLVAGCASFALTLPIIVVGWVRRAPDRGLATAYFAAGYALMAAGYTLDSITNPPLFIHGFIPGIGVAQVAIAITLVSAHVIARHTPTARPERAEARLELRTDVTSQ